MSALITISQPCASSSIQHNQARKIHKSHKGWKGKHTIVLVCGHDNLEKLRECIKKNLLELISDF